MTRAVPTLALTLLMGALAVSCAEPEGGVELPSAEEVEAYYDYDRGLEAEINGNVATVRVAQDPQQLRRGGSLWAKVGPYVFLFTDETHSLLRDFPGLAGVRVTTHVGQTQVATALLGRGELSEVLWLRGKNIAGRARRDGTGQVTLLEDLVAWGESHTEFEYSSRFTSR